MQGSWSPDIVLVLASVYLLAGALALALAPRGGRFRALPGWTAFWLVLVALMVALARLPVLVSMPLLGVLMFAALREYFYLAPLRPGDHWAILFAYLSVPAALVPVWLDSFGAFLAVILLWLFFVLPGVLSVRSRYQGLLDSMGRVLLGMLVFGFCAAHLGWMTLLPNGQVEYFGALALVSDFPQRVAGRPGRPSGRALTGLLASVALTLGLGAWLGRWVGISAARGLGAGALVTVSVTVGGMVTEAVAQDLALGPLAARVGRAAMLDRLTPVVYAAPLYYHYMKYVAN